MLSFLFSECEQISKQIYKMSCPKSEFMFDIIVVLGYLRHSDHAGQVYREPEDQSGEGADLAPTAAPGLPGTEQREDCHR